MSPVDVPADDAFRPPADAPRDLPPRGLLAFAIERITRLAWAPVLYVLVGSIVLPGPDPIALGLLAVLGVLLAALPSAILVRTRLFPADPGPRPLRVDGVDLARTDHLLSARALAAETGLATVPAFVLVLYAATIGPLGIAMAIVLMALGARNLARASAPWMRAEAVVALSADRPGDARRWATRLLRLPLAPPAPDRNRLLLATACLGTGDPAAARATLDGLDRPDRYRARILRAHAALAMDDPTPARALLTEPRPADPDALAHRLVLEATLALVDGAPERVAAQAAAWPAVRALAQGDLAAFDHVWAAVRGDQPSSIARVGPRTTYVHPSASSR